MRYFKGDIELKWTGEDDLNLEVLKKQKFILYFYPKDDTSACTLEALDFSDLYFEIKSLGYEIYGVSKDGLKSHERFISKFNLSFNLISDEDKILHEWFDVIKEKKLYGKKVIGTERSTFVFDEELKCIHEFRGVKAKGHAASVLDFIQG